jgi:tetratricopeptide (TPR) repeat protein
VELLADRIDGLIRGAAAQRELGASYLDMDRPRPAVDAFQRAISLGPGDAETWLLLGRSLEALQCDRQALDAFRSAAAVSESAERTAAARERIDALAAAQHGDDAGALAAEDRCELEDEARP